MKRQLTAIFLADAAGYSRLTGQNEEHTHQHLNTGINLLTERVIAHGGSKVHEAGDAILAEFSSVTAAVDTAVEFQKLMATRESDLDKSEQIEELSELGFDSTVKEILGTSVIFHAPFIEHYADGLRKAGLPE